MIEIITVKFQQDKRVLEFLAHDMALRPGDRCVVATDRGVELGIVVRGRHADNLGENRLQKVLRKATERDLYLNEKKQENKMEEVPACIVTYDVDCY